MIKLTIKLIVTVYVWTFICISHTLYTYFDAIESYNGIDSIHNKIGNRK